MLRRSVFQVFLFAAALVVAAAADGQTGSTGQRGPSRPTPPKIALPDLTITAVKATTTCANGTVTATIVATVKNGDQNGLADLSKIPFAIVMDANWGSTVGAGSLDGAPPLKPVKPQSGGPKTLKPGETWTGTMTITGVPRFKAGAPKTAKYVFTVNADPLKGVAETDEKNNGSTPVYASDPCPAK